jgi:hypothetical protein
MPRCKNGFIKISKTGECEPKVVLPTESVSTISKKKKNFEKKSGNKCS